MAKQAEIEALYDWIHYFHTLRLGEYADWSCAFFDGDFSKTLKQAQRDKHAWVLDGLRFKTGGRHLDIGCGWGPMLNAVRSRGGEGVGLTLSRAQTKYGTEHGLDVVLQDWKTAEPRALGMFDGVFSIGAFEHFCSIEEYRQGKQDEIYRNFFKLCASVLPAGGRLYLHTMTWGKMVPDPNTLRLSAPEGTPERILARLARFYPGSWLPAGKKQILEAASGHFDFLHSNNGWLDYIETLTRWGQDTRNLFRLSRFGKVLVAAVRLVPRFLSDADFRVQIESLLHNDQQVCFQKEIMSHERMFFQKK